MIRTTSFFRVFLLGLCMLPLFSLPTFAGTAYTIRFDRPFKAGEKFLVEGQGIFSRSMMTMVGGRVMRNQKKHAEVRYKALLTIVKVNANGQATEESQKIVEYKRLQGKKWVDVLAKGTLVLGRIQNGKKVFSLGTMVLRGLQKEMPSSLTRMNNPANPGDDMIFGSANPRKIGEVWPINASLAAKSLSKGKVRITANGIKGFTRVAGVTTVDGVKCLNLKGAVNIPTLDISLPPSFSNRSGRVEVKLDGHFPLDLKAPVRKLSRSMLMLFSASGQSSPQAPPMAIKMYMSNQVTATIKKL